MPTLDQVIATLPTKYPGPGGAVAVLHNGKVLARHTWGYADTAKRMPFTPATMFLACSITKQFTCALMLDQNPDPTVLDDAVRARLPDLDGPVPTTLQLAHNQSGMRDYWASAMLTGPRPEDRFTDADARALIARTRSLHFAPGTRYSYCNQNFRILGDLLAERAKGRYADLLRSRIFDPAGMPSAVLTPDPAVVPGGTVGYEGSLESGFRPAVNNINWTGDAGIAASLDDFIAWEKHIDATRDDASALYTRLSAPTEFADGTAAQYGYGLNRTPILGRASRGHGGGLRGWRSFRFNLPAERISVVVLFNHMADPRAAALDCLRALLDEPEPAAPPPPETLPAWNGRYQEPETGLAARIDTTPEGKIRLHYSSHGPELLIPETAIAAQGPGTRLEARDDGLWMTRPAENQSTLLAPVEGKPTPDIAGRYHSAEYAADFTITEGAGYAGFSGGLGQGEMQPLIPFAKDLWLMPCPRALDHGAPGDWTVEIRRDPAGRPSGLQIGCWLSRRVEYRLSEATAGQEPENN